MFGFIRAARAAFLLALLAIASQAQAGNNFAVNNDGTVTDPATGLTWMRCAMGQTWAGSTCTGTAAVYNWDEAVALKATKFAERTNWRVPTLRELQSIVDRSTFNPAIDSTVFPNTPAGDSARFWSTSADANNTGQHWTVKPSNGVNDVELKTSRRHVRLVSGDHNPLLFGDKREDARYEDHGDGTVTDIATGLMWQRCAVTQIWDGSTCVGITTSSINQGVLFDNAVTQRARALTGRTDWRAPTLSELLSLVDYTKSSTNGALLNSTIFPNAPNSNFGTTTPVANDLRKTWVLGFGSSVFIGTVTGAAYSRLVRSGPFEGPLLAKLPGNLSSPTQTVGFPGAAQIIMLTSVGNQPLVVKSIDVVGDFSASKTCLVTLTASEAGCSVSVIFSPTSSGAKAGTLTISTNAADSPHVVNLTGSAVGTMTVPSAPTGASATVGNAQATVSFSVPSNSGGSTISGYSVKSNPAGIVATGASSPIVVTGLSNGVSYTFTVTASNQVGVSVASAMTNSVTPLKDSQSINFGAAPSLTVGRTATVSAVGGSSGNAVTFSSITPVICSVSANSVTALTVGGCIIAANQAGNANYAAAPQATQNITVSALASTKLEIGASWNLLGNSVNAPLDVSSAFSNPSEVTTVWKWIAAEKKWAFYAPEMADGGVDYALTKGYDPLVVINGGEGFWVNAKIKFTAQLPPGTSIQSSKFQDQATPPNSLPTGWSLIAIGDDKTPSDFNKAISLTPPAPGAIPSNITSLWAWNSAETNWYFYASSMEASDGLAAYNAVKRYLDFGIKTLTPTTGFWVNRP